MRMIHSTDAGQAGHGRTVLRVAAVLFAALVHPACNPSTVQLQRSVPVSAPDALQVRNRIFPLVMSAVAADALAPGDVGPRKVLGWSGLVAIYLVRDPGASEGTILSAAVVSRLGLTGLDLHRLALENFERELPASTMAHFVEVAEARRVSVLRGKSFNQVANLLLLFPQSLRADQRLSALFLDADTLAIAMAGADWTWARPKIKIPPRLGPHGEAAGPPPVVEPIEICASSSPCGW